MNNCKKVSTSEFKNNFKVKWKMKSLFLALIILLVLSNCSKKKDVCNVSATSNFGFKAYEYVLDTALLTDTSFVNRDIVFKTNSAYSNISWKIGGDPRIFTNSSVRLKFLTPENLTITLKGDAVNQFCNTEQLTGTMPFVLLDDNGLIQSPLVGYYHGYNVDKPSDTFTVAIKFWFGTRYPWWSSGAYSVENLPKGFIDSTQNFNGYSRPEIRGIISSTGYKNIAIDKSGNFSAAGIKGYGSLRRGARDSLLFNYTIIDTARFNQTGQLTYIKKSFFGIKN